MQSDQFIKITSYYILLTANLDEGVVFDFENTFLMGHSSGAHVTCEYLSSGCNNVKGNIMLSPVDGIDPLGIIRNFCTSRLFDVKFDTPSLIIAGGLDQVPG